MQSVPTYSLKIDNSSELEDYLQLKKNSRWFYWGSFWGKGLGDLSKWTERGARDPEEDSCRAIEKLVKFESSGINKLKRPKYEDQIKFLKAGNVKFSEKGDKIKGGDEFFKSCNQLANFLKRWNVDIQRIQVSGN